MNRKLPNLPKPGEIVEGRISINKKGVGYVRVKDLDDSIEIDHNHLNTALHGDRVKACVAGKTKYGLCAGEVLEVIARGKKGHAGVLEEENGSYFLIPQDHRMYTDIHIPSSEINGAKPGDKIFVTLLHWKDPMKSPWGRVEEILGAPGDNNAEMRAIALERGFSERFPDKVEKESEKIEKRGITEDDAKERRDFRETLTFTIDPADAKDFDDALSFKELPDEAYEIGVHIADVSHYVREGTEIDKEAERRNTSVYLVDRTIPMLPEALSNNLCSLVPKEDRLTFGAVFVMNKNAEVVSEWFGRTIIHSKKRFTYEEAQEVLNVKHGPFFRELSAMNDLAKNLHDKRFRAGAIALDQEEVKFVLDEKGVPISVYTKVRTDTHKLIEEFMLLANRKVAEFGSKNQKGKERLFVYRVHAKPDEDKMLDLSIFLRNLGLKVHLHDGIIPSSDLNHVVENLEGKPEADTVQTRIIRSMQKAEYTVNNIGHYGLAFGFYTHFTSPIRRYPDVLVHRLLSTYLSGGAVEEKKSAWLAGACEYSSEREKEASEAERGSIRYKQVEYMSSRIGETYNGIVSGLSEWGVYIEEEVTKCEGMVMLRDVDEDFYTFDERKYEVRGERSGRTFTLGDKLKIKVRAADLRTKTIDYELIP